MLDGAPTIATRRNDERDDGVGAISQNASNSYFV